MNYTKPMKKLIIASIILALLNVSSPQTSNSATLEETTSPEPFTLDWKLSILDSLDQENPRHELFMKILGQSYCLRKDYGVNGNKKIAMASVISDNDLSFLATIEIESGWNENAVSPINSNGTRDYGVMQLNSKYHWKFINSEEFKDVREQLKYGYAVYQDRPQAFYGWYKRKKVYERFICPEK
jgi:hypothetical protein